MFSTTADCESYLRARFSSPRWRCPRCRESGGHWLPVRKRWECARCRAQIGLRHGTVFEHSPLPLTVWFCAIRTFAGDTAICAHALMSPTGIRRLATAQTVLRRIRGTLEETTFDRALAGLMAFPLPAVNEHSAHKKAKRNCDLPAQQVNRNH
jgi:transposase-like protein